MLDFDRADCVEHFQLVITDPKITWGWPGYWDWWYKVVTGRMLLLSGSQQCQSTVGECRTLQQIMIKSKS